MPELTRTQLQDQILELTTRLNWAQSSLQSCRQENKLLKDPKRARLRAILQLAQDMKSDGQITSYELADLQEWAEDV